MATPQHSALTDGDLVSEACLTYRGLIVHLAEQPGAPAWASSDDLPKLSLEQLGAVLQHYPGTLLEAICEFEPTCTNFTRDKLGDTTLTENQRLALIGDVFVQTLNRYVGSLILRDVQIQVENNIIAERLAAGCPVKEVLTADQARGFALGVGRLFS